MGREKVVPIAPAWRLSGLHKILTLYHKWYSHCFLLDPWVRKIPWSKKGPAHTPVFLPAKFYEPRGARQATLIKVTEGSDNWLSTHTETKKSEQSQCLSAPIICLAGVIYIYYHPENSRALWMVKVFLFHAYGDSFRKSLTKDIVKVTQLVSNTTGMWPSVCRLQYLCSSTGFVLPGWLKC